jgi:hypothetical protein
MRRTSVLHATVVAAMLVSGALIALTGHASDHNDAPGAFSDNTLDLTDLYLFRSPTADSSVVFVMNVSPFLSGTPAGNLFSNNARYQIHIDTDDADLTDNKTLTVTFSGAGAAQRWRVEGLRDTAITGLVTTTATPVVYDQAGVRIFAGLRDDPFFFDLGGFQQFEAAPHSLVAGNGLRASGQVPTDFFAGKNVAAIVLEVPVATLGLGGLTSTTGVMHVWLSTSKPS